MQSRAYTWLHFRGVPRLSTHSDQISEAHLLANRLHVRLRCMWACRHLGAEICRSFHFHCFYYRVLFSRHLPNMRVTTGTNCRALRTCIKGSYVVGHERASSLLFHCIYLQYFNGARGSVVGWGTMLQTGRSRVRFPVRSLDFLINIIPPAALWPWGRLSL
jgi:hypothetical protein